MVPEKQLLYSNAFNRPGALSNSDDGILPLKPFLDTSNTSRPSTPANNVDRLPVSKFDDTFSSCSDGKYPSDGGRLPDK
jgi:hypothetical protein